MQLTPSELAIASRMKKRRLQLGLKIREVLERMKSDLTLQTYHNWEAGTRRIRNNYLMEIAGALGVSLNYLVGLDGDGAPEDSVIALPPAVVGKPGRDEPLLLTSDKSVSFSARILKERNLLADKLLLVIAKETNMSPKIQENDRVLIDLTRRTPEAGGDIFALMVNGQVWFRWIQPEVDGSYTVQVEEIHAGNASTSRYDAENLGTLNIIGRVAAITRFR